MAEMQAERFSPLQPVEQRAPRIPFDVFMENWHWGQGQHLAIIGPTGKGKTTLAIALLPKQPFVSVMATKPKDETMNALSAKGIHFLSNHDGYQVFRRWPQSWPWNDPKRYPRRIIWPKHFELGRKAKAKQRDVIYEAMAAAFKEGNWCVFLDELYYVVKELGLESEVKQYLLQGRSLGISLACATQRPAWVPLEIYDMSTHLFFFRDNDETNLKRISGISGERSQVEIRDVIRQLDEHEFLYINARNGAMIRSQVERKGDGYSTDGA